MNAFLLVTTAWLASAEPAMAPAAPAAKPAPMAAPAAPMIVPAAPMIESGCASCGDCATCEHGFRHRLKGMFGCHHKESCGCDTCAPAPAPKCCAPAPAPKCCAPAPAPKCCAPAPAPKCETCEAKCDSCCGSMGHKLRGLFHRKSDCGCGTDCGTCSSCGAPVAAPVIVAPGAIAPQAEPIPAPQAPAKKMPNTPPAKSVQNLAPEAAPVPVGTPALETAPAVIPNVPADADRKEPF